MTESGEEDPTIEAATTTDDHWLLLWHAAHQLRKLECWKDRVDNGQYQVQVEKQPGAPRTIQG